MSLNSYPMEVWLLCIMLCRSESLGDWELAVRCLGLPLPTKAVGKETSCFFFKPENYSFFLQAYLKMLLLIVSMEEAWVNYGHFQECTLIQRCSASLFRWVPADKTALCNAWVSITSGRCRVRQKVPSSSKRGCLKHEQPQGITSVCCSLWFWLCFSTLFAYYSTL